MGRKRLIAFLLIVVLCVGISAVALTACKDTPVVTFDSAGGSAVDPVEETVNEEPVPTRDGYVFGGWYTSAAYDGERVTFPYTPEESVTLYAKWTEVAKEPTVSDHLATVMDALTGQLQFDGNSQFGAEAALDIAGLSLKAAADIDPANLGNVKAYISFANAGGESVSLYADDEFLYITAPGTSKRIKGLMLADMLKEAAFPAGSEVSSALTIISAAAGLIFNDCTVNGSTYTFTGDFSALVSLAELLGIALPSSVTDLLSGVGVTFEATLDGETFAGGTLTANTSLGDIAIGVNKASIANGAHPAIAVPAKDDPNFDESYALNLTLEGSATFGTRENLADTDTGVFNYEIRADFDLFGALRNAMAGGAFDASKLFDLPDSKIFIDISHICGDSCAFCTATNKKGPSRGSVLTVAYSPEDFGTNNLYLAVNIKNVLPDGFVDGLIGSELEDSIIGAMGEYIGTTLDPAALFTNSNTNTGVAAAALAGGDLSRIVPASSAGILNIMYEAIQFIGETSFTEEGGMRMSVSDLFELLESLTAVAGGTNIASMLNPFFGGADYLDIKVDTAVYGDSATADMDMYHKFMTIDENIGDYKSFSESYGAPALTIEWEKDENGFLGYTNDEVLTHDEGGKLLNLSADEWKALLSGSVGYNYTAVDGTSGRASAEILKIFGLDYNLTGVPQNITIVTDLADGGVLNNLLGLLSMIGIEIDIPSAVIHTTVTVASVTNVELSQPATVDGGSGEPIDNHPYDANKEYKYMDYLNPQMTATITYSDGSTKQALVDPEEISSFYNYGTRYNAQVQWFGDFELHYYAFGREFALPVNMADGQLIQPEPEKVTVNVGGTYTVSSSGHTVTYKLLDGTENTASATIGGAEESMIVTADEGVAWEASYQDFLGMKIFNGYNLTFSEAGTYEVSVYINKGYTKEYVFTVVDPTPDLPGYDMDMSLVDTANIRLDFSRTDQLGDGVTGTVKVEIPGAEGEYTALTFGTDFKLYTLAADGSTKQYIESGKVDLPSFMVQGRTVYVEIVNEEFVQDSMLTTAVRVTVTADNYGGATLCTAEITGVSVDGYSFNAEQAANEASEGAEGEGDIIVSYTATVADEDKVEGMTYSVDISASWEGGSKEGLDSQAYVKYAFTMMGMNSTSYMVNENGFDFTAEGINPPASTPGMAEYSGAYFVVSDAEVLAAVAGGSDVTLTITVTGTLNGELMQIAQVNVVIPGTVQA